MVKIYNQPRRKTHIRQQQYPYRSATSSNSNQGRSSQSDASYLAEAKRLTKMNKFDEAERSLFEIRDKKTISFLLTQAFLYFSWQKYQMVISICEYAISENFNGDTLYNLLGRAYKKTKQFKKAVDVYRGVSDLQNKKWFSINLANCLRETREIDEAINILNNFKGDEKDVDVALALACAYEENGDNYNSVNTLVSIREKLIDDQKHIAREQRDIDRTQRDIDRIQLGIANLYSNMKNFNKAREEYEAIKCKNRKTLILGTIIYENCEEFQRSIDTYRKITGWDKEPDLILSLSYVYQKKGDLKEAIRLLGTIDNLYNNKKALLCLGICHQKKEEYKEAFDTFDYIIKKFGEDIDTLITLGIFFEKKGEYENACKQFDYIRNKFGINKKTLITQARCFEKMGEYRKALEQYEDIITKILGEDEEDKETLRAMARCLAKMDQRQEALKIFNHIIDQWGEDKETLLAIALVFIDMQQYAEALKTYEHILETFGEQQGTWLSFGYCHTKMGQFEKANRIFRYIIDVWGENKKTSFALGHYYEEMHDYKNALVEYVFIKKRWETNTKLLMQMAFCFEKAQQFDQAIATFTRIGNQTNETMIALARCREKMGQLDIAREILEKDPLKKRNKKTHLILGRVYAAMDQSIKAILTYQCIEQWMEDPDALIAIARVYKDMKNSEAAFHILRSIPNLNEHKKGLLTLAGCHQTFFEIETALEVISNIPNAYTDRDLIIAWGCMLEKHGDFNGAIDKFISLSPEWRQDKNALISLAHCYENMGVDDEAEYYYEAVISKFPYYQEASYSYCNFLLHQTELTPRLEARLSQLILQWSHNPAFSLLQVQLFKKQKDFERARVRLEYIIANFPYFYKAYLALIQIEVSVANMDKAKAIEELCWQRFKGNYKLFARIKKSINSKSYMQYWSNAIMEWKMPSLDLPEFIHDLFATLQAPQGEAYLVGSVTHCLRDKQPLKANQDVDFVFFKYDNEPFELSGYQQNEHIPCLYKKNIDGLSVDCYVVPTTSKTFKISVNALSRDFTISCVFVDKEGTLFDPTGKGVDDYKNKILRTVIPAEKSFKEDPIRLLRAINWIAKGFRPTENIKRALREPDLGKSLNMNRFYSSAQKELSLLDDKQRSHYIDELCKYGLAEKIFGFSERMDKTHMLSQLHHQRSTHDNNSSQKMFKPKSSYEDILRSKNKRQKECVALETKEHDTSAYNPRFQYQNPHRSKRPGQDFEIKTYGEKRFCPTLTPILE